jgi:hypothetical protein
MAVVRDAQAAGWLEGHSVEDAYSFTIATIRGVTALLGDPLYLRTWGDFDRDSFIERMVRLIINPASPKPKSAKGRPRARSAVQRRGRTR